MTVFYQKYRPQTLEELDSAEARQKLLHILSQKNLPHAFLMAGPRGIGKTSSARVLARSLNCPFGKNGEPCNQCDICREISRGESLDVLEIDAASNRGIDDIRQLKEKINLQPIKAKNKIYIIDEVHMLTKEAFNAILKILEEPPTHVFFVLCTTNPEKIPETVMSRLLRIDFQKAGPEEVRRSLARVIKNEKIKIKPETVDMIVQSADGSFRDAHKILFQLWLEGEGKVKVTAAKKVLARWRENTPLSLLAFLAERRDKEALLAAENLAKSNIDWLDYYRRLLETVKEVLFCRIGVKKAGPEIEKISSKFSESELVFLTELFQKVTDEARGSFLPQLPLQLAILNFREKFGGRKPPEKKLPDLDLGKRKEIQEPKSSLKLPPENAGEKANLAAAVSLQQIEEKWAEVLTAVKPMNHSVNALLRACRPKNVDGQCLILEVFYQFHKDQLEVDRNRRIVETVVGQIFQVPLRLRCELGQKPARPVTEVKPVASDTMPPHQSGQPGDDIYELAKEIFGN